MESPFSWLKSEQTSASEYISARNRLGYRLDEPALKLVGDSKVVITAYPEFGDCALGPRVVVMSQEFWGGVSQALGALPFRDKRARLVQRLMIGYATPVVVRNRLNIPNCLVRHLYVAADNANERRVLVRVERDRLVLSPIGSVLHQS